MGSSSTIRRYRVCRGSLISGAAVAATGKPRGGVKVDEAEGESGLDGINESLPETCAPEGSAQVAEWARVKAVSQLERDSRSKGISLRQWNSAGKPALERSPIWMFACNRLQR